MHHGPRGFDSRAPHYDLRNNIASALGAGALDDPPTSPCRPTGPVACWETCPVTDPWAELAALDARELQVLAWLADVRSQRAQILADLRQQSLPVPPERLLEPGELVERWKEEKLPHAPTSAEALLLRLRRAKHDRSRWQQLHALGQKHRAGRTPRWPWSEARRVIKGETA